MTLYPDVQKRAQEEIDRVVGKDRLPTIEDQDNLIYVGALIKEVLRFAPVAPLGGSNYSNFNFLKYRSLPGFLSLTQVFRIELWRKIRTWDTGFHEERL